MLNIGAVVAVLSLVGCVHSWNNPEITKTACQGQWLNIDCPTGTGLNIKSANFGRYPGQAVCGSYGLVGCVAPNSLLAVRTKCQGQGWCKIPATEGFFGSQCKGNDKYLQVRYTCDYPPMRNKFVCQDDTLNIDCKKGHHIVIDNALFGRVHGNAVCPTDPYWLKSIHCVSSSGLDILKSECQEKQWCKVHATVGVFGDPCPGTSKYLFVRYTCEANQASVGSSRSNSGSGSSSGRGSDSSGGRGSDSSGGRSSSSGKSKSGSRSGSGGWL